MGLDKLTIYFFNIWHIDAAAYLSSNSLLELGKSTGLQLVETVYRDRFTVETTVDTLLEMANRLDYPNGNPAEGIVWRPANYVYSQILKGRLSFKTVSNRYLEKYKE